MGMLKLIEWKSDSRDTIVYRVDLEKDYITKGSKLTVREGQACVFCDKGRMADVFLPGMYTLGTDNVPLLTKLMSWKYGFESPFKSDVYFVNTRQFTGEKWGTKNPIIIRDADYGAVRVRAFGTYAFKVDVPYVFLTEISGAVSSFRSSEITEYLRSMAVTRISDIIGESKVPVLDMAGNLVEFGEQVQKGLDEAFKKIGLTVTQFNFENFSLPEALEKVWYTRQYYGTLVNASKNPGTAGGMMGAGIGMGMGVGMGNMFMNMASGMSGGAQGAKAGSATCPSCGAAMAPGAKFCPECGAPAGRVCPKCGAVVKASGARFCPECGASLEAACPKCGAKVKAGAKFCPECGEKLR